MVYELKETEEFRKRYDKLPQDIKLGFEKRFMKVQEDPFSIGKPLNFRWLRELKNHKYRVYYYIYRVEVIVLFVGVSDKKNQQEIIDLIKENRDNFKDKI